MTINNDELKKRLEVNEHFDKYAQERKNRRKAEKEEERKNRREAYLASVQVNN
jgi:hypothetical protein